MKFGDANSRLEPYFAQMHQQRGEDLGRELELTDAVEFIGDIPRPKLYEGYKTRPCLKPANRTELIAAVSRTRLLMVFCDLIEALGDDIYAAFVRNPRTRRAQFYGTDGTDPSVVISHLMDFEDVVLDDGKSALLVLSECAAIELEARKLLSVEAVDLGPFERVMKSHGIPCRQDMATIKDCKIRLKTTGDLEDRFVKLKDKLSMIDEDDDGEDWKGRAGVLA